MEIDVENSAVAIYNKWKLKWQVEMVPLTNCKYMTIYAFCVWVLYGMFRVQEALCMTLQLIITFIY